MSRMIALMTWLMVTTLAPSVPWAQDEGSGMAEEHAHDTPVPTELTEPAPRLPVTEETVPYAEIEGTPVAGYLARPEGIAAPLAGLIVIHEWWGLNDNVRAVTRRLAGEGYVALAVDLYVGQVATTPDEARAIMQGATENAALLELNLRQAYAYLEAQGVSRIGVIGWCFGGGWSLNTALFFPSEIDATVIYYGHLNDDAAALATLNMPVIGFFGDQDQAIPVDEVRTFESTLTEAGKIVEIHVYEGAGHAFANPSGTNYNAAAATDAWDRTVAFLNSYLQAE